MTGSKESMTCNCKRNIGICMVSSTDKLILKDIHNPQILLHAAALQWATVH